jgi:hypothetical protein
VCVRRGGVCALGWKLRATSDLAMGNGRWGLWQFGRDRLTSWLRVSRTGDCPGWGLGAGSSTQGASREQLRILGSWMSVYGRLFYLGVGPEDSLVFGSRLCGPCGLRPEVVNTIYNNVYSIYNLYTA